MPCLRTPSCHTKDEEQLWGAPSVGSARRRYSMSISSMSTALPIPSRKDQQKDASLSSCRVLEGKEQLRHPDSTNPSEKLPLESSFPSPGLYFLLPPCSLHPVQSWWCSVEQGGWNRGTMQSLISSPVSLIYYCMRGSFRTKLPVREIIP